MSPIRTVVLELLRHGPPHNQLLSPLTRYLALCGNHPAGTLTFPFEHQEFKALLRALQYRDSQGSREIQLTSTARVLEGILGQIQGLGADVGAVSDSRMVHLRLVLSASELALLPFELADTPGGLRGAGQPFLLQSELPICLTREVRRVSAARFDWSSKPRILFAAASPAGIAPVPLDAHLLALRRAIDPWMKSSSPDDAAQRKARIDEHLVVLPSASITDIKRTCSEERFTHVHLLAHGVPILDGDELKFGLALHDHHDRSRVDRVSGARLAASLLTRTHGAHSETALPGVVTIAACQGGDVGSVVGAGASIAHELHENGVPLVVASQFPLSFKGSVILAEELYGRLLWADDPRDTLIRLRGRLKSEVPNNHDWASVVTYASFPPDLAVKLRAAHLEQANRSNDAALDHADQIVSSGARENFEELLSTARAKIARARSRLEQLGEDSDEVVGWLASGYKREAQMLFEAWKALGTRRRGKRAQSSRSALATDDSGASNDALAVRYRKESDEALRKAFEAYGRAWRVRMSSHWVLVQYLSLAAVLGREREIRPRLWAAARVAAELDLESENREKIAWAHGSLAELYALAPLRAMGVEAHVRDVSVERAAFHARQLVARAPREFLILSTLRQFKRYRDWFFEIGSAELKDAMAPAVQKGLEELPGGDEVPKAAGEPGRPPSARRRRRGRTQPGGEEAEIRA